MNNHIFIFMLVVSTFFYACQSAEASCAIQDDQRSQAIIEEADFIGIVKIYKSELNADTSTRTIQFEPIFVYKFSDRFVLEKLYTIIVSERNWSSCDYILRPAGVLKEVVIYKSIDNEIRIGNKSDMALGDHWRKLRSMAHYVGSLR